MTTDAPPGPVPRPVSRSVLRGAAVLAVLVGAATGGRAVAGPATPPRTLPPPSCAAVLGDALPATGPSSPYFVPWGPVSGRVCAYPTLARPTPETAPVGQQSTLDATRVAEAAGLLEDLPQPAARCVPDDATSATGVVVLVLRYRPGTTPTVGEQLRLVVRAAGPCVTVTNGGQTVQVDGATFARLLVLAPPLGSVFPVR